MSEVKITVAPNIEVKSGGKDGLVEIVDYLIGRPSDNEVELNHGVEMDRKDYLKLECPSCKKELKYSRSEVPAEDVVCKCGQIIIKYYR